MNCVFLLSLSFKSSVISFLVFYYPSRISTLLKLFLMLPKYLLFFSNCLYHIIHYLLFCNPFRIRHEDNDHNIQESYCIGSNWSYCFSLNGTLGRCHTLTLGTTHFEVHCSKPVPWERTRCAFPRKVHQKSLVKSMHNIINAKATYNKVTISCRSSDYVNIGLHIFQEKWVRVYTK